MQRLILKKSTTGLAAAGLFLLAFLGVLWWVYFVASANPADSGESGILLLPFAMPWVMWLPVEWLNPWSGIACAVLNSVLLYLLCGGLRFGKSS